MGVRSVCFDVSLGRSDVMCDMPSWMPPNRITIKTPLSDGSYIQCKRSFDLGEFG